MEIKLNREFAMRHLGVAVLMAALCGWFFYDGAVKYPSMDDATFAKEILHGKNSENFARNRATATNRQFQFAGLSGFAALIILGGVLRAKRQTLSWNGTEMIGSLTLSKPLDFADIIETDRRKWETKGIIVLKARDGRRLTLDAWHHTGVKELVAEMERVSG